MIKVLSVAEYIHCGDLAEGIFCR